jgi:hypothetical protein
MFTHLLPTLRRALLAAAGALLVACQPSSTVPANGAQSLVDASAQHSHAGGDVKLTSDQLNVIAQVRAATARFHDVEEAVRAGYVVQYPAGCATSPSGTQGFHYLNPTLASDAVIDPLAPELLMYEPGPQGQLELVGVDYVIKYSTLPANTLPKPTVLGVDMMNNNPLEVWALHIWSRRPNPSGMFAAWNPNVSCANAGIAKLPQLPQ